MHDMYITLDNLKTDLLVYKLRGGLQPLYPP